MLVKGAPGAHQQHPLKFTLLEAIKLETYKRIYIWLNSNSSNTAVTAVH